jgi:chromosomal replication initiator protein
MANDFPFDHFLKIGKVSNDSTKQSSPEIFKNQTINTEAPAFDAQELNSINQEVLGHLKSLVPEIKYKTYFENNLELKNIEEGRVYFEVKTSFIKKSTEIYKSEIAQALESVLGALYEIIIESKDQAPVVDLNFQAKPNIRSVNELKFTLDLTPTKEDISAKVQSQYIEHVSPSHSGIVIDRNKTFDNYIVGPNNNMAQAVAKAVAETPGKNGKYPSLYIHSNSGLGKTHLLHAVANEINEKHPKLTVCLITARDFMEELISLMKINRINDFVKKYTEKIDVLMIDDIHELKNKEATQDQFFHVFNEMYQKGKQLIFTSDKRPNEITGIAERVKSRLQGGLVVDIQPPDLETRIAILRRKMEDLDLYITEDVLTLIASRIKTNIRELEGSLVRLKAVSELMNVEIEIELVKEQLKLTNSEPEKELTIEMISKATAQYYRIQLADMKSKARSQEIVSARHVAMYLSRKLANAKFQEIASFFGGRDHSTVIHAVETITDKIKNNSQLSLDVNAIESNL